MKVYIAGAISNNPNYLKEFAEAEKYLIRNGYTALNPTKNEGSTYKELIDKGLMDLMQCEAIYMLPGWENSVGAGLEYTYAKAVGLTILEGLIADDGIKRT